MADIPNYVPYDEKSIISGRHCIDAGVCNSICNPNASTDFTRIDEIPSSGAIGEIKGYNQEHTLFPKD